MAIWCVSITTEDHTNTCFSYRANYSWCGWFTGGAWWSPDKDGVDHGGCPNVLTSTRMTPLAHGNSHLTVLVEVTKA